jgi:hypothetical protein
LEPSSNHLNYTHGISWIVDQSTTIARYGPFRKVFEYKNQWNKAGHGQGLARTGPGFLDSFSPSLDKNEGKICSFQIYQIQV